MQGMSENFSNTRAIVRDTAVVLSKKHEIVRCEIFKYVIVHTSNKYKFFDVQANAKQKNSNYIAERLVS